MATEKRRFYNTKEAKGFTREVFFESVKAILDGEDLPEGVTADLLYAACDYELESIEMRRGKNSGEKRDALQSNYAVSLAKAIIPLLSSTPLTANELQALSIEKGIFSDKVDEETGKPKPFAIPWIARVLSNEPGVNAGVEKVLKVVEKKNDKGLVSQEEVPAYIRRA